TGRPALGRRRPLPTRAQRRHETARMHRDRDLPAAEGHPRRRADQRARRGRAAPGHGHATARTGAARRIVVAGRPRHGSDGAVRESTRGDVRRPPGRSVAGARAVRGAAASVRKVVDRESAVARGEGGVPRNTWLTSVAAGETEWLCVPPALSICDAALRARRSAVTGGESEYLGRLSSVRSGSATGGGHS